LSGADAKQSVCECGELIDLAFGFQSLAVEDVHCKRSTSDNATAARLEAAREAAPLKSAFRSMLSFSVKMLVTQKRQPFSDREIANLNERNQECNGDSNRWHKTYDRDRTLCRRGCP